MQIMIRPTVDFATVRSIPCSIWHGTTLDGKRVVFYVACAGCDDREVSAQLARIFTQGEDSVVYGAPLSAEDRADAEATLAGVDEALAATDQEMREMIRETPESLAEWLEKKLEARGIQRTPYYPPESQEQRPNSGQDAGG